jgi:hypothetical protein
MDILAQPNRISPYRHIGKGVGLIKVPAAQGDDLLGQLPQLSL